MFELREERALPPFALGRSRASGAGGRTTSESGTSAVCVPSFRFRSAALCRLGPLVSAPRAAETPIGRTQLAGEHRRFRRENRMTPGTCYVPGLLKSAVAGIGCLGMPGPFQLTTRPSPPALSKYSTLIL